MPKIISLAEFIKKEKEVIKAEEPIREVKEFIKQPESQVPIYDRSEVIVIGGGAAGLSASVVSARLGRKTILVEQGGCLGGTVTLGLQNRFTDADLSVDRGFYLSVNRGLFAEFYQKLADRGALVPRTQFDNETFKSLAFDFVEKEGVELLLHTTAIGVLRDQNRLLGVLIANKSGIQAIMGEVIIDASGDADVAAMAGEAFDKIKKGQHAMSLFFRVGGVDLAKFTAFLKTCPEDEVRTRARSIDYSEENFRLNGLAAGGFFGLIKKARESGELNLPRTSMSLYFLPVKGTVTVNATHVIDLDPVSGKDLTLAEIECRKQMMSVHSFLRKSIPGFDNSFIMDSASHIGIRESRRVIGEYVLTFEDIKNARHFDDAIGLCTSIVDIHGPGEELTNLELTTPYQIPYRCLQAKVNENLLVAGRCISTDHITQGSSRKVACCFMTGQAAATAAALSVIEKKSPKKINIGRLKSELEKQGVVLQWK